MAVLLLMNATAKELIGLNIIWLCIVIFGTLFFGYDITLKDKIKLMIGLETFLLLMQAGVWFLII